MADEVKANPKKWWMSKTLWFNGLSIIVLVVDHLSGQNVIPKEAAVSIIGVVNMILRVVTNKPVSK